MNQQFRSILNDEELANIETVKAYLQYSFRSRKPKKDYKLYINICKIYNVYPNTITDLLDNIPTLGYYKDYFYILMFSRNNNLNTYIYDLVVNQLHQDLDNLKQKKPISTIGKWLPRESSKINKQCNFIDNFTQIFYPNATDKFNGRRKYRKLKTMLNNKLGTLEAKMCTKQYSEIDFNKVAHMALERNSQALMKHDECKVKLDLFETNNLKKLSLADFTKELINNKYPANKLEEEWTHNRYRMEIPYIDKVIANSICIIDLSKDTFANGGEYFALGVALLVNHFSMQHIKVIVCNDIIIDLNDTIVNNANKLMKYIGPCREISIEKYCAMAIKLNESCQNLIIVSNKNIDNIEFLENKKMTLLQFMPFKDSYDIVHYAGDKVRRFRKYEHKTFDNFEIDDNKVKKDISMIISDSNEFKDKKHIYAISFLILLFVAIKLYEFLFNIY